MEYLNMCESLLVERDQLRADKAELLAALKPFADMPVWSGKYPSTVATWIQVSLSGSSIETARTIIAKNEAKP
jgi:hypothetical protein